MVDMANFTNWTRETTALAEVMTAAARDYIKAHPDTRFETVVPALLLAAHDLAKVQGQRLGATSEQITVNFERQCKLVPLVDAERAAERGARRPLGDTAQRTRADQRAFGDRSDEYNGQGEAP